jgi:hypothetical protein
MTSVTTQATAKSRLPHLLKVGGKDTVRGVSVEPLWEEVSLKNWLHELRWIIVGGESGPKRTVEMDLGWARKIRDECREAGVAFFFKQVGGPVHKKGGDLEDIPQDLRIREVYRVPRSKQINNAGRTYRLQWDRVPVARELAAKLDELAKKKGKTRRYFLGDFLREKLP